MRNGFDLIRDYLAYLEQTFGYDLVVLDPFGMIRANSDLEPVIREYINHTNPMCLQVKSNLRLWRMCVYQKKPMISLLERSGEPFWGECYCGVAEYVYPCHVRGQLVGAICACGYRGREIPPALAGLLQSKTGITQARLEQLRRGSLTPIPLDDAALALHLGVLASLLERVIGQNVKAKTALDSLNNSREQQLLVMQAMEYIRRMYMHPIKVKDVADFCHMSESYLQHLVSSSQGSGIYELLVRQRMDHARSLLTGTRQGISRIAASCGFADVNHFITSFRKRFGVTPGQYRKSI